MVCSRPIYSRARLIFYSPPVRQQGCQKSRNCFAFLKVPDRSYLNLSKFACNCTKYPFSFFQKISDRIKHAFNCMQILLSLSFFKKFHDRIRHTFTCRQIPLIIRSEFNNFCLKQIKSFHISLPATFAISQAGLLRGNSRLSA